MKFILKIEGAESIDKTTQRDFNGGRLIPRPANCAVECASPGAYSGQKCGVGSHCPGVCDGHGGYYAY